MDDQITVIISSSPIKSHPSTEKIDECIEGIRTYLSSKIIVMADGVRDEQFAYAERYAEYLTRLQKKYPEIQIVRSQNHRHQAGMTKLTIPEVETPLVLFMEHDFILYDEIPMQQIAKLILDHPINLVRFMLDAQLISGHSHMMLGAEVIDGIPLMRTKQWSQRPHLARTSLYQKLMDFIPEDSRTMLEDLLHGVIGADYDITGEDNYKMYIYTPEGETMQRVRHNDGREDDPKYEMIYD